MNSLINAKTFMPLSAFLKNLVFFWIPAFAGITASRGNDGILVKFFFSLIFFCGGSFSALACDCDKIKRQHYCEIPDCIRLCNLTELFSDEYAANAQLCLDLSSSELKKTWKKSNLGAFGLGSFVKETNQTVEEIEARDKQTLENKQKNGECENCELIPELNVELDTKPKGSACPDKYLKTYSFKRTEIFSQSPLCFQEINDFFKDYVAVILKVPFYSVQKENKKKLKKEKALSKQLYDQCPSKCSFETVQAVRVNHELCTGDIDLKVSCTHKKKASNISIEYKRGVQCKK